MYTVLDFDLTLTTEHWYAFVQNAPPTDACGAALHAAVHNNCPLSEATLPVHDYFVRRFFGDEERQRALRTFVETAYASGIVVIASRGNTDDIQWALRELSLRVHCVFDHRTPKHTLLQRLCVLTAPTHVLYVDDVADEHRTFVDHGHAPDERDPDHQYVFYDLHGQRGRRARGLSVADLCWLTDYVTRHSEARA